MALGASRGADGCAADLPYVRIGGVAQDLPEHFIEKLRAVLEKSVEVLAECESLLVKNRIFRDRMDGVGTISAEDAIAWGWTGPCLRSTGVPYDVRKDHPYLVYDRFEFDVPVGSVGDNYDRVAVRLEEIRQSMRILDQACKQIRRVRCFSMSHASVCRRRTRSTTPSSMIGHFKLIVDGIKVPPAKKSSELTMAD